MHRLVPQIIPGAIGCMLSVLMLFACTGPQKLPDSEIQYTEGILVEGGVYGFRLEDLNGTILRFTSRGDVEYHPKDFHAFYGDRLGVNYQRTNKSDHDWHAAVKVVILSTNPDRINFQHNNATGIIRETGMMRQMVHIPEVDITVPFYKKSGMRYSPKNWSPEAGDQVSVSFDEDAGRFLTKYQCYAMNRLTETTAAIEDKTVTGVITAIGVQRGVHKAPSNFTFRTESGEILEMFTGGKTQLLPEDHKVTVGEPLKIKYYRKMMADLSLRYVATVIEKTE